MNLYIGSRYNQTCDSKGPHNSAILTNLTDGTTHVSWTPTIRTNFDGWEQKWGGPFSWDNLYCWVSLPFTPPASTAAINLVYNTEVTVVDLSGVNTFEEEIHAVPFPGEIYNMAWQFKQTNPLLTSTFNYGHGWEEAFGLSKPVLTAGKQTRLCALYQILPKGPHHVGVQFNDIYQPVDIQRPWVKSDKQGDQKPHLNFAWQFDSLNNGKPIEAIIGARVVVA